MFSRLTCRAVLDSCRRLVAPAFLVAGVALSPLSGIADEGESPADGGASTPFNVAEEAAIERLVRNYILDNPEIIREAIEVLRTRQEQAESARQRHAVRAHKAALHDSGPLPVLGNPDGDVTVVEFFDYRCPYCQRVAPVVRDVIAEDGNVRLVMKEFPILGENSVLASRAAIAAAEQGAYAEFHDRLMADVDQVSRDHVMGLAETMGLDVAKLEADMRDDSVQGTIEGTYRLAQALGIGGTPAFVVGETLVSGALDAARLRNLIDQARSGEG